MDLVALEQELKKRHAYPYIWGRKQNDRYDNLTRFVYRAETFDQLLLHLDKLKTGVSHNKNADEIVNYAMNRWYNYWSARAVEDIFCSLRGVLPVRDRRNRLADFSIHGILFDHKTTIFPAGFTQPYEQAKLNPRNLIIWLYRNQSKQRRKHFRNRLFIVLYASDGNHWKLKAEIGWLKKKIETYVAEFNSAKLHTFHFEDSVPTYADIIWGVK